MIKELTLKGFKSFYDETLKISPLTVLTGLNSSGKSSVIQSLLMLRNRGPLEGHGTIEELTNIYYSTRFSIQIKYITPLGVEHYRGFGPEAQNVTRNVMGGPQFIYVSADRFGPRSGSDLCAAEVFAVSADAGVLCQYRKGQQAQRTFGVVLRAPGKPTWQSSRY